MDPIYQRGGSLWDRKRKSSLIDSILNDFDIPRIYIADFTFHESPLNRNMKSYAIIDGKQRLEAIFDFFEDRFALDDGFLYDEMPGEVLAGMKLSQLRERYPEVATKFENFNLTVAGVITDDEGKINELFVRLNSSKPLTGAEVRNAMRGVLPSVVRDIAGHPFFAEYVRFSIKRGQDKNAAAKLLLIEFRGEFADTKRKTLDRFAEEGLRAETSDLSGAASRLTKTLDLMTTIFEPRDALLRSQGALPLYYWLVRRYGREFPMAVRAFLQKFEEERRQNRILAKLNEDVADQELLLYDALNRSTDDQSSYEGRFRILSTRFWRYADEIRAQVAMR